MSWHYSNNDEKAGPVELSELSNLISAGVITDTTLLWQEGMPDWKPYRDVKQSNGLLQDPNYAFCAESGKLLPKDEMARFGDNYVSAEYKDAYLQKIQEGVSEVGTHNYASIGMRFVAKFVDGILLGVVNMVIMFIFGMAMGLLGGIDETSASNSFAILSIIVSYLAMFGIGVMYNVIFLPKSGATPGKMLCKIKVVEPDGSYISKGKAAGRYFAELISSFTFLIGYIIAFFDDEKRTLHDRICDTRVTD